MQSLPGMKHPAFQDALALTKPAGRKQTGRYLAEDLHLVRQALADPNAGVDAVFALPAAADELTAACAARKTPLYVLTSGLLGKLVGTGYDTAAAAVAVVAQRLVAPEALLAPDALILCGESIQDPRNVGVLVRTADALGCAGLLLSSDSAEPYARAAVRSTTGSILRLPISLADDLPAALHALRSRGATVVASSGAARTLARDADLARRPLVVVVGNEQSGITERLVSASDAVVRLPMSPETGADSFNVTVAAGMLLYEAIR